MGEDSAYYAMDKEDANGTGSCQINQMWKNDPRNPDNPDRNKIVEGVRFYDTEISNAKAKLAELEKGQRAMLCKATFTQFVPKPLNTNSDLYAFRGAIMPLLRLGSEATQARFKFVLDDDYAYVQGEAERYGVELDIVVHNLCYNETGD